MKNAKTIAVAILATQFSCAAIFHGTKDTLTIRSREAGTTIYVNEIEVGREQAVTLVSKDTDAVIRVSKPGCTDASVPVPTSFDPVSLLGLILDLGLVSMLVVDYAATGAITRAAQTNFIVTPSCPTSSAGL